MWKTRIHEALIFLIERGILIGNVHATLIDGEHRKSIRAIPRNPARKNLRRNKAHLDALIAEAIVDAYNESEQTVGFYTMMEHSLALPFATEILGIKVAVEQIDWNDENAIVDICRRGGKRQRILDLPLPLPTPRGAEWIAAYRYWRMGRT
ncbi:MAG: calcium-binding protein [Candidatus Acidiferrum sp.]